MKLNEPCWAAFDRICGGLGGSPEGHFIADTKEDVLLEMSAWGASPELYDIRQIVLQERKEDDG